MGGARRSFLAAPLQADDVEGPSRSSGSGTTCQELISQRPSHDASCASLFVSTYMYDTEFSGALLLLNTKYVNMFLQAGLATRRSFGAFLQDLKQYSFIGTASMHDDV
ncbi:hypothetical protein TWF225_001550 [Orbilia oligospora]|nr:hypothetical protein TWF751_011472 [Orbilia oligospora]KAF3164978.1 hypothetical protein TWF225_001550 [Orbilia oligospora]KAF3233421.1 hypothetical protein TWF128_003163 [Orbilia oligospora]KAF3234988.1 hypothetical protein TWF217_003376 [Orbilia oligospora]KAF3276708.1 hypothetical protein TWF132_002089 [Orbilia oligospora]